VMRADGLWMCAGTVETCKMPGGTSAMVWVGGMAEGS
jgi:hypothetical protein